jgi:hypothetical protein
MSNVICGGAECIPAPPSSKPVAFYDTECYPNYWTLKLRVQNGPVFSYSLRSGESFSAEQIEEIEYIFSIFQVISFNGIYYDVPVISAALCGFSCDQLKWVSDEIIVNERKPWQLGIPSEWKPADHIDIKEVLPGAGSLKQYGARTHAKKIQDLPYEPNQWLTEYEISQVDLYCINDLDTLEHNYNQARELLIMREHLSERYGTDLRSKSDAQMAETVIKLRCEQAIGARIYKPEIDWNVQFRYEPPAWLSFQDEGLKAAFHLIKQSIFFLNGVGRVDMPAQLESLEIPLGKTIYKLGIGGLHSKDEGFAYLSDDTYCIRDNDVASYYPNLILMSGKWPPALGAVFLEVLRLMKDERLTAKALEKALKKQGKTETHEFKIAHVENEGGKVMINGTFGKTGSPFSILFAPEMMIQTTITGQLALLMLIEWHEMQGIHVISANTDGMVIHCPRDRVHISESIIDYWQKTTGLEMETTQYLALYSRDVNNYFAIKEKFDDKTKQWTRTPDGVKRKGEYAPAGLIEKKNPDVEICGDAVADFLEKGLPVLYTVAACRDIRKFVRVQKVTGGGVKLWGEGPREIKVKDMAATLENNGWQKDGRRWNKNGTLLLAGDAYKMCFQPQKPEYIGKVVRWYYGTNSPGPIVYNKSGNTVGLSYGAQPCMTLPDDLPGDINYTWYVQNCNIILTDVGYFNVHCERCGARKKDGICQNYGCETPQLRR